MGQNKVAENPDVVVIGGGFYGCCLAVYLRRRFARVVLFEREPALMMRASRVNQARLHNGYHYPRSFLTAARSHANLAIFRQHYPEGVEAGFRHFYAIARNDSKVGRRHFERQCCPHAGGCRFGAAQNASQWTGPVRV